MNLLIVGAGGQGQTVAEAVLRAGDAAALRPVGFLDDTPSLQGTHYLGVPVLGTLADIDAIDHDGLIVAIGDNRARRRIYSDMAQRGFRFAAVIHPAAVVPLDAQIGPGSYIGANATIGVATRIGANCIINGAGCIGHHNAIGDHVHFGPGVHCARDVRIGEGCQIGLGSTLVSGVSVGAWSQIGAASLVARDIGGGVFAIGSPARSIRRLDAVMTPGDNSA